MKRWFKIVLVTSLVINVSFIILQIRGRYLKQMSWEDNAKRKYAHLTAFVNVNETKKKFMDSLFLKYPQLKAKKYLFINFWDTGDQYSITQLPILDTLINPLLPDVGYVFVNDETQYYLNYILKNKKISINNFLFVHKAGNFIQAINQELRIPRKRFIYPITSMNLILDNTGKIVYFDTLESWSGPKWPEDSLNDKKIVWQLNKAFSELK